MLWIGEARDVATWMGQFSIAGKWADLIKQMVPSIRRVAIVFPEMEPQSRLFLRALEAAAPSLGLDVMAVPVQHSTVEIEATLGRVAREPNIALIAILAVNRP